jgi:CheY-like chemotaxis protein
MTLKGKRIFVTEDNAGNLAVLSIYLETMGAKIILDRRGIRTVDSIRENMPIDVILLDLMLPNNISGFDIFDQIRKAPDLAHIPVVAISASDPDVAMPKARIKGFNGFISKPVPPFIGKYVAEVLAGKPIWIAF